MHFRFINIFFFLPAFFLFGCGVWGDFTTYFNLYYNTTNIFNQAEDAINSQKQELFSTEEVTIPGSATQLLNKVIQKTSQILQFHSGSAYVDNALLILGKSFFYQKNYLKALRKFQELIATRPESNLILETRLWIGKTEMRLKNYNEALPVLDAVIKEGTGEGKNEIVINAYVEEIKYKLLQQDYSGAIASSKELLNISNDSEVNADVVYEIGKLYNLLNDPQNAIASFQQVFDYSPSYETEFNAKLELGKAFREASKPDQALNIFTDMRSKKNYSDSYDQIDLELGITQVDLKNYSQALDYFRIVDTGYTASKVSGLAKYRLGELYQYDFLNYDSASYYYSKALTAQLPADYILKANEKIQKFRKYKTLHDNISQNYKKLDYVLKPENFLKDSIAFYSDTVKTTSETESRSKQPQNNFTQGRGNSRRFSDVGETQQQSSTTTTAKIPPIRPNISEDSIKTLLVQNLFDLGNLFFTEFNLPDSAYKYYETILNDFPESNYKARTLYALGSYYETINENSKADSLYNIIYNNYQNESVVNAAASKLNKPTITLNFDPAAELYTNAEQKLLSENYSESLHDFYNIYKNYPKSPLAPKALYATGWILQNQLDRPDSAAIFYDSVSVKYPKSIYAAKISSEISYYNQEKERRKKAIEDSLKLIEIKADSLKADSVKALNKLPAGKISSDSLKSINRTGDSLKVKNSKLLPKDSSTNPVSPQRVIENKLEKKNSADSLRFNGENRREINRRGLDTLQKNLGGTLDSLKPGRTEIKK